MFLSQNRDRLRMNPDLTGLSILKAGTRVNFWASASFSPVYVQVLVYQSQWVPILVSISVYLSFSSVLLPVLVPAYISVLVSVYLSLSSVLLFVPLIEFQFS